MPLFKPNISKMKEKGDIDGLIKLLRKERNDRLMVSDVMNALVQIGEPAIEGLIKLLSDAKDKSLILSDAIIVLLQIGKPAIEPLLTSLKELPSHGIFALMIIGKPAAGLIKVLLQNEDTPPIVRQLAEAQLQEFETPDR